MNNCKNYKTDNGDTWVIGGSLKILEGAKVEGLDVNKHEPLDAPANIEAESVEGVVNYINNTLLPLFKAAGITK